MTLRPFAVESQHVATVTPMTRDLLGIQAATACLPYWRHVLSPLSGRLEEAEAQTLARLAWFLSPLGTRAVVVYYPGTSAPVQHGTALVDRILERGRLLKSRRRVVAVDCATSLQLSAILMEAWALAGNDTVMVVLEPGARVEQFLRDGFVDDAEANPVNEEALLPHSTAIMSRGWDGVDLRVYSRTLGPNDVREAIRRCSSQAV